ncbi:MAG: bifunctional hydroxymethylpyrimidine kinase/phosphomethylpyrimidine kinase [Oceanicoccus sp.]|uniref:bifunctional hydroxymethylpyrimidine kinase/phosphomethylpyrimidine kinase n=1 Tax=Oceanicoccus sp. TaxID=2691044 RepID=UPI00262DCBF4|nr:bifunctional hydroxymethylpyrimidine kinase/phosphomethylpyrimidine kinase [Oceanicoccus sp.]MDG1772334.1 bifunctional hydroxymethylpyrimidine kinase/phosphomethylpyrimidine kinase [Oceanicoccus sp.]
MSDIITDTPVVMSITGHDPSGGGGISADIETLSSLGCHCTPIVSQLVARDTHSLKDLIVTDTGLLIEQIRALLEDIPINLLNIGSVGSIGHIEAIHTILNDYPYIPVIFHPRLSGAEGDMGSAMATLLLPQSKVAVLSKEDALSLAPGADTLSAGAQELLEYGSENLLIIGDDSSTNTIGHHWFAQSGHSQQYQWQRLPNIYYGANSTLCAALSAYLAHGLSLAESIQQAQQFCWQSLQQGRRIGMGKLLPNRMHWSGK